MKHLGLWVVTATLVLSFTTHSFAQAPMGTPNPAMPGKGEMKGEMPGGMKTGQPMTKEQPGTSAMKQSDPMMEKPSDGMEKKSGGMMENKQP
ncbi:MAG TPA: hypothetical protein VLT62_25035 [Candidatus Methylomirabilis sp.]|nr:hypothetical protein [Candidatus Methylomirabilis sp.]